MIPVDEPYFTDMEMDYVKSVFRKRWISQNGEFVKRFEEEFSKLTGSEYAIALNSGTSALETALKGLEVRAGELVVVPNFMCNSLINTVLRVNALPVIAGTESKTWGMSADSLENILRKKKRRVKAVITAHVFGFPSNEFLDVANLCLDYDVKLIEDASQALGANISGRPAGSFGDASVFSLRSDKMIGVGEGGILLSNDESVYRNALRFSSRGLLSSIQRTGWRQKYCSVSEGMNYLMSEIPAAIGLAQLEKLDEILRIKREIAAHYRESLDELVIFQTPSKDIIPCYWRNAVIIRNSNVEGVAKELRERGIETSPTFWPLMTTSCFGKYKFREDSVAKNIFLNSIVLPSSVHLSVNNFERVRSVSSHLSELLDS